MQDYVGVDDLAVGKTLSVMGRGILLYSADERTFDWYKTHRGVDMRKDVVDAKDPEVEATVVSPPAYLG